MRSPPPNVLLVVLDSVRAENVSLYDYQRETTPFLTEFKSDCVVYKQARAPAVWTYPSHASIYSGEPVAAHGMKSWNSPPGPGHSIWEELQEAGYETGVFSINAFLTDEKFGLTHGFDTVVNQNKILPYPEATNPNKYFTIGGAGLKQGILDGLRNRDIHKVFLNGLSLKADASNPAKYPGPIRPVSDELIVSEFIEWVSNRSSTWGACINLVDAHIPYRPKKENNHWGEEDLYRKHAEVQDHRYDYLTGERPWSEREDFVDLYDGAIYQTDQQVKRIIDSLRESDELDNTLVVITSDHGEGFGEQSRVNPDFRIPEHKIGVHESLLHVPLIVRFPDGIGGSESGLASLTRFPDVVRSLVHDSEKDTFLTSSLIVDATTDDLPAAPESLDTAWMKEDALVVYEQADDGIMKYVEWGEYKASLKITDEGIQTKTADVENRVQRALRSIDEVSLSEESKPGMTKGTEQQLEDLGYL